MSDSPAYRAKWLFYRGLYRLGLGAIVALFVYFVPTRMLFGQWTKPVAADFAPYVREQCVPVVRALLAYGRDHGHPIDSENDLVPKYLPDPLRYGMMVGVRGEVRFWTDFYNEYITYRPDDLGGVWMMRGAFVNGPVPVPIVHIDGGSPGHATKAE
jgi:hypothetical protein